MLANTLRHFATEPIPSSSTPQTASGNLSVAVTWTISRHVRHFNRSTFKSPRRALFVQVDSFRVARYPGLIPVGSYKLSSHHEFLATTIRITAE
jgi:hypothetical protein